MWGELSPLLLLFQFFIKGIEFRPFSMLGKCSTSELTSGQPFTFFFLNKACLIEDSYVFLQVQLHVNFLSQILMVFFCCCSFSIKEGVYFCSQSFIQQFWVTKIFSKKCAIRQFWCMNIMCPYMSQNKPWTNKRTYCFFKWQSNIKGSSSHWGTFINFK